MIVAVVDLQQLAFADLVCRPRDDAAGELRVEAGAEMVAVADQVIAQQHGGLVAAQVVDRRALAAQLGFVQYIVVNQRRHVDHLDDGGDRDVRVG
jgi:hypothetical protein